MLLSSYSGRGFDLCKMRFYTSSYRDRINWFHPKIELAPLTTT
jgi:hypothetical protein